MFSTYRPILQILILLSYGGNSLRSSYILDYLLEDMPQIIDSMKIGCDRIKDISNSLRTFSRTDTTHPIICNIHDGIDSTLMILKHRLKANENRPEI